MLTRMARSLVPAKCCHSIATGCAGLLGAMLRERTGRRLLLSEHRICAEELEIDLFQSTWIAHNRSMFDKDPSQVACFRRTWVRFFETLRRMCRDASDRTVALHETHRLRRIADGAPPERTTDVANGIDLPRLAALRDRRGDDPPPMRRLIGRAVPIKDLTA